MGLGLYISREIVDRHGGQIWAESTPERGSAFHVALPRVPAEAAEPADKAAPPTPAARTK
jgi:signal transduction histidine kinase